MVKGQDCPREAENYWNVIARSPVKDWKGLLVTGKIEILAGQDFDRGRRYKYITYTYGRFAPLNACIES